MRGSGPDEGLSQSLSKPSMDTMMVETKIKTTNEKIRPNKTQIETNMGKIKTKLRTNNSDLPSQRGCRVDGKGILKLTDHAVHG